MNRKNAHHGKFDHLLTRLDLLKKARTPKAFLAGGGTFKNENFFGLKRLSTNTNFNVFVTESQNCLVLPAPHKRASRPAPDFTVLFY